MPECFVAKASDLKDGDRRIVVSGQHEVGVFFKDGAYYAYSNYCVHAGGPACEGILVNNVVDILNAGPDLRGADLRRRTCISPAPGTATNTISRPANASATAS